MSCRPRPMPTIRMQPASLDLRLGPIAYRVRASFLPGPGATVVQRIKDLQLHVIALNDGAVLETGCRLYRAADGKPVVAEGHFRNRQSEKLDRPHRRVHARHRRSVAGLRSGGGGLSGSALCGRFRRAPFRCWCGRARGCRRSGSVVAIHCWMRRNFARCMASERLVDADDADLADGVAFGVDLSGEFAGGLIGYRAKRHTGLIDVDLRNGNAIADFWEPMAARADLSLVLDPNEFYIRPFSPPKKRCRCRRLTPPRWCHSIGWSVQFRVHYAGFFDPGFYYAGAEARRSRAVLEVQFARSAVHFRSRPDRRPSRLREDDGAARYALRARSSAQLPCAQNLKIVEACPQA